MNLSDQDLKNWIDILYKQAKYKDNIAQTFFIHLI